MNLLSLLDHFYINYFTIATIENFFVYLATGLFLLSIPKKSKPTLYLGITLCLAIFVSIGYILSQGIYEETAFPRVITLIAIPFHFLMYTQFLFQFPTFKRPKVARAFFIFQVLVSLCFAAYIIQSALSKKVVYDFSGHYYDYNFPAFLKLYGLMIIVFLSIALVTGISRSISTPKGQKQGIILISLGLMIATLFPAIGNIFNKLGFVSRDVYFITLAICNLTGTFIIVVTYINKTIDRTTFMFKVVSISFLTFLLIYNALLFVVMGQKELTYNELKLREAKLALQNSQEESITGLKYILSYKAETGEYSYLYNSKDSIQLGEKDFRYPLVLTDFRRYIEKIAPDVSKEEIEALLHSYNPYDGKYLNGYKRFILWHIERVGAKSGKEILEFLDSQATFLFYKANKIKGLADDGFRESLEKFLLKEKGKFIPFANAYAENLRFSQKQGEDLKQETLLYLLPLRNYKERNYRSHIATGEHFVAFHIFEKEGELLYEVGFSYQGYREFIHNSGKILFYILLGGLVIIVFGSPIFLSGALVNPLESLLEGLRKVRKGNLDIRIPVKVQDEIGYLTTSFNNMVESIADAKVRLEEYSNQLEDKVKERTQKLQLTLDEVKQLKTQQDGDYFLTTLLLKPLGENKPYKGNVHVEFFVKQKKQFQFRKKEHDIGGDICISQEIQLRDRKFIVFLNADAMGKSMQGAGGILVLGAVFQSIIQRTNSYNAFSDTSPEKWVKSAFKEMHKIFESFDGSMLISLIFGLVDEETGLVYYINAEHPWLILYRDGTAEFIEKELSFRKLGTPGLQTELYVSTFAMQPGDILLVGSDGKDDLVLEERSATSNRVINEDESLFLKRVEEAEGNIHKIFEMISERYELMDDFSLLSIQYPIKVAGRLDMYHPRVQRELSLAKNLLLDKKVEQAIEQLETAYEELDHEKEIQIHLIKLYLKVKNYQRAEELFTEYLKNNQTDTAMLLKASYCMKMNRNFTRAIEVAERVRLREPFNLRNLIHLADMYAYRHNFSKAKKMLGKIRDIEPENANAQKIQNKIDSEKSAAVLLK
ncbi:MAG: SpoIIE family protein phosphatase [Spirochaetota bacterium]